MHLKDKTIVITGAAGTIGRGLVSKVATHRPKKIIAIDNNETEVFFLNDNAESLFDSNQSFEAIYCDIRNRDSVKSVINEVDVVFHCAALKHVGVGERTPTETIRTNIEGTENIIFCSKEAGVEQVVFTSSDKAVNPTNVMGASKLLGEKLITAANSNKETDKTKFISTRFGNVIGSRGSVLPIFANQIANGRPVTITDVDMTRFVMTVDDACSLVVEASGIGKGGEVFVTKMPIVNIKTFAFALHKVMLDLKMAMSGELETAIIGPKPGEKLYEELMSSEETRRAVELENMFAVLPSFLDQFNHIDFLYDDILSKNVSDPYVSKNHQPMTQQEIEAYLMQKKVLEHCSLPRD